MKLREDFVLALRSMRYHLVETVLLTLGIALGIGATSAAVAVVARTLALDAELSQRTEYREITVVPVAEAENLELAAIASESDEAVTLSSADLAAREEAPDVSAAYVMNGGVLRMGTFFRNAARGQGPGADPPSMPEPGEGVSEDAPPADLPGIPDLNELESILDEIDNPLAIKPSGFESPVKAS